MEAKLEATKQKNKALKDVLRKIAVHVGFTDDSSEHVTPTLVEQRVKEMAAEIERLKTRNKQLEDNQFALPSKKRKQEDDGYVEFDVRTHADAVRKYGVDHPVTKATEQSFSWSPRLAALLGNPLLNQAFQVMEFDFPAGSGIEGNEEFKCSDGSSFTVVGYLPNRPVNCIAAVRSNVLYKEERSLVPTDLCSFAVNAITRSVGGAQQLKQLRQERVVKYSGKYGIEDWAVVPEGFEMSIQQHIRRVCVYDLSPVAKKKPIYVVEVAGSVQPGTVWSITQSALEKVERPGKRLMAEL